MKQTVSDSSLNQYFQNSSTSGNHLEDLWKHRCVDLTPGLLTQSVWDKAAEFAFLTSFQVLLLTLLIKASEP